jgi:adenylate cyclase
MSDTQATILVVDDEIKNSKLLEALLTPRGYKVIKAFNGQQAIDHAREHLPDLILMDVMMPVMDGYNACKMLKEMPETRLIPVVFMTALGQVEDRIKGLDAGADDFLTKPVNRDELMARIRGAVRHKKLLDQRINVLESARTHLTKFVPLSVQQRIAQNPVSPDLEKRKQDISALFVDITGYTRLSEELAQEHVSFLVESLFSGFVDVIGANGGEIGATAGDGMMVMFLDEDPRRNARNAVQTAMELIETTRQLGEQPDVLEGFNEKHEPIRIHIGINSGEASVGPARFEGAVGTHWTYTAVGSPVNVAARIAALAQAGTALISEETAARVRDVFALKEVGPREFKNVSQPIMIYQVAGALAGS